MKTTMCRLSVILTRAALSARGAQKQMPFNIASTLCVLLLTFAAPQPASALDRTWSSTAGTTAWNTGANWDGGTAPANADTVTFSKATYVNLPTMNLGGANSGRQCAGITVTGTSGQLVTISGTGDEYFTVNGTIDVQSGSAGLTLNLPNGTRISSGNPTWQNDSTATLSVPTPVYRVGTTSSRTIYVKGTGNTVIGSLQQNHATYTLSVNKSGAGTLTLTDQGSTKGKMTITGGTVAMAGENRLGDNPGAFAADQLKLDGGTLKATATFSLDDANRGITLGASGGTFEVDPTFTLTIDSANVIAGSGALTKTGTGTLTLSAANTYSGLTTVTAGSLVLSGSGAIGSTPTLSIAAGATFSVSGISGSSYTLTGSSPQQTLACGSSSGTATVDATGKPLTLASGALATFKANGTGAGSAGKISVTGDLTLNANAITVDVVTAALGVGSYRLLDCTGTLANSGTFGTPTITGLGLASGKVASLRIVTGAAGYVDLLVTTPPDAVNDSYSVLKGMQVKFKKSELLSNDTDADGDPLSITAFSTTSPGGRTLSADSTYIFYPGTLDATDSFTYTVSDGKGGTDTAMVNITALTSATGQVTAILNASGAVTLKFAGIPGYTYEVERATDSSFTTGLTTLLTTNLPASPPVGVFSHTDSSPPNPQAYYRLKYVAP